MVGETIGEWKVLKHEKKEDSSVKYFKCECSCGNIELVRANNLRYGGSKTCKDCRTKKQRGTKCLNPTDFIGKRFGKRLVLEECDPLITSQPRVIVQCECGQKNKVTLSQLHNNKCQACRKCNLNTHGLTNTPTYYTWRSMKHRCMKQDNHNYKGYGGRGIIICERWLNFKNFLEDMGPKPEGMQIDRINNDGNYEPGNCRWVTPKENSNNRRKRLIIK